MTDTYDAFTEAERYLNNCKAGWTDPEVNPIDLIEEMLLQRETMLDDMVPFEEHDRELETAREQERETLRAELLDPETATVSECMDALGRAFERELTEAIELERNRAAKQIEEIRKAYAERTVVPLVIPGTEKAKRSRKRAEKERGA